jgi:hypothetical protein
MCGHNDTHCVPHSRANSNVHAAFFPSQRFHVHYNPIRQKKVNGITHAKISSARRTITRSCIYRTRAFSVGYMLTIEFLFAYPPGSFPGFSGKSEGVKWNISSRQVSAPAFAAGNRSRTRQHSWQSRSHSQAQMVFGATLTASRNELRMSPHDTGAMAEDQSNS